MEFLLEVDHVGQTCVFKLSGNGHRLGARMSFPKMLQQDYQEWLTAYQECYAAKAPHQQSRDLSDDRDAVNCGSNRGRPGASGTMSNKPVDWEKRLTVAENRLVSAFRKWLRGEELFEIWKTLSAHAAQGSKPIVLLVQCQDDPNQLTAATDNFFLAKLPWESFGAELSDRVPVQVLRTTIQGNVIKQRKRQSRLRILAIFGDDTGLDFKGDRQAIERKLKPIAYVQFEGYNISTTTPQKNLKTVISEAIEDSQGWDILFFAGHSDDGLGGEILLAPGYAALISEFEDSLKVARNRGLQFALFNSCRGCAIAESLISYGISHVVVMRERVTNKVAQVFFEEFADRLAKLQDVQVAAIGATQFLASQAKERYQYPSAHLLPSIYAYPGVEPLKPPPFNWRVISSILNPTRREVILLAALLIISGQGAVQYRLVDYRQAAQGVYRKVIQPLKSSEASKVPILVVQLDDKSLQAAKVSKDPIDRGYIAKLMEKATDLKIPTVGIDYVLKDDMPNQAAVQKAVEQGHPHQFIFAASNAWGVANSAAVNPNMRIDGHTGVSTFSDFEQQAIFLARTIGDPTTIHEKPIKLHSFPHQILCQSRQQKSNCEFPDHRAYYNPVTAVSRWFGQWWLHPWIDYSIPAEEVYKSTFSADFLRESPSPKELPQPKIALLVPSAEFDHFPSPIIHYGESNDLIMAGGEIHAYLLYNLLHQGLIIPIPDIWMVGIVGILSKFLVFWLQQRPKERSANRLSWLVLLGGIPVVAYAISLQTYVRWGIAIPVLFPALAYFSYVIPYWWKQRKVKQRQRQLRGKALAN